MSRSITSEARSRLTPLLCVNCNAPLIVVDAPSLACRFCAYSNVIPEAYREELRLTRDLDSATRQAAEQWLRLAHIKTPRWWLICAAIAPFALMTGSLIILLGVGLLRVVNHQAIPMWLAGIWLLLIPAQLLAANIAMKNVLVSGATNVGAAFAAKPPSTSGEPPSCRQCGAPLSVEPDDVVVRCIYCEAESIVQLDQTAMASLRTRVASAQSSLAEAMSALTKHARLASLEMRGRTYVIAGLLVLPLLWAFIESWTSSYWSLLIALDVFILALCVFWNVREAFLPPVTIEELESVIDSSETKTRAPGTRGWYDHANDRVNFLVPLLVTLLFVGIQILVLTKPVSPSTDENTSIPSEESIVVIQKLKTQGINPLSLFGIASRQFISDLSKASSQCLHSLPCSGGLTLTTKLIAELDVCVVGRPHSVCKVSRITK